MRLLVLVLLAGCASSPPPPIVRASPTPPPPAVQEVSIAKSPVVRFEKTEWHVFSPTDHGLAPRATVSYADVACRTKAGHMTCAMRAHDDKRPEQDLGFQARLEQCFRVTAAKLAPSALRAIEASPKTPPKSGATFTSVAFDELVMETQVLPVIDCPGPPCPATKTVQAQTEQHAFNAYFGAANEIVVEPVFAMRSAPIALAIVEDDWRFTQRVSDPRDVLLMLEKMDLEKENDAVRFANVVDRPVLAFEAHLDEKGVAYTKELEAWLAAHTTAANADLDATRATLAALSKGTLRTTDPCPPL